MLLSILLAIHLFLAATISVFFIYRYVVAWKNKAYPTKGQKAAFGLSASLVVSGVLLAVVGKLPIKALCLESLGLVVGLLLLEVGLYSLPSVLAYFKSPSDRNS